jgi:putative flavoprotein involved in K+ transport
MSDGKITHDVAIIGASQSGLALARCLQRKGMPSVLFDAASSPGAVWRSRYDSLRLFTPAQYCNLPDRPFPAKADTYPTKDQVADYLDKYAAHFELDVRPCQCVERVSKSAIGFQLRFLDGRQCIARQVAVTGGALVRPFTPPLANALDCNIQQLHSSQYLRPTQIRGKQVLVVGAGNSGAQIAEELAHTHRVSLAFEKLPRRLPQRFLGLDIFWWLQRVGVLDRHTSPRRDASETVGTIPLIGSSIATALKEGHITARPRVTNADERGVIFADRRTECPDAIIWATGFRPSFELFDFSVQTSTGELSQSRGVSEIPGLYFIGVPGQNSKGSGFLGFVGRDAASLADVIAASLCLDGAPNFTRTKGVTACTG